MKDEMGRDVYKSSKHCTCEMPFWTVEDMYHCAKCLKLLPDVKGEEHETRVRRKDDEEISKNI